MTVQIGCIVEGHGEVESVPILIRRVAASLYPELLLVIDHIRVSRSQVVKTGELERSVELIARKVGRHGAIFIILDSDADCPAQLGPELRSRALKARGDLPIAVVLAKCEFEAWFLAAAESLRGKRGLNNLIEPPANPEEIGDAKGWLSRQMTGNQTYDPTADQPSLTAQFDLDQARNAASFDKCYRDIVYLINELREACDLSK